MCRFLPIAALSILAWVTFFSFGCSKDLPPPTVQVEGIALDVVQLDSASFDSLVYVEKAIAMIDFFSPTCPASRQMETTVAGLSEEYSSRALVAKVNVIQEPGLAMEFGITHVPTFVFFADGIEAARRIGIMPVDSLSGVLDSLLAATSTMGAEPQRLIRGR